MFYFVGSVATITPTFFGRGSGPIVSNRVACTGSEARLIECPSGVALGCTHYSDVGVRCSVQTSMSTYI